MAPRGLWDDFQQHWTPIQKALYLGQLRDQYGKTFSKRAKTMGIDEADLRSEIQGSGECFCGMDRKPIRCQCIVIE